MSNREYTSVDINEGREFIESGIRYRETPWEGNRPATHGADLMCLECGVPVWDTEIHGRFHSILSSHAWAIAVLSTSHISESAHDRYEIYEKIRSKKFDNWSDDAFKEVTEGVLRAHE